MVTKEANNHQIMASWNFSKLDNFLLKPETVYLCFYPFFETVVYAINLSSNAYLSNAFIPEAEGSNPSVTNLTK